MQRLEQDLDAGPDVGHRAKADVRLRLPGPLCIKLVGDNSRGGSLLTHDGSPKSVLIGMVAGRAHVGLPRGERGGAMPAETRNRG